ncbi:gp70 [Mycobacterium phage Barnyard]|uniref:Uncharacterized protein n=1 Tax=Mycobacterium phage Barnyard TaxID=205880 RepID=Q856A2_9CAUD|nr:gp70 [Mycobacterium phage Barnyard]AAN02124.1 hypothetical protein PBI_BARNYARD_70 [Mycobacterium phage Barnyard]
MTVTDESVAVEPDTEAVATEADNGNDSGEPDKDNRDRDFTKYRKLHEDLANYVNEHSGLDPITPNQVKAVLYLRPDFNNTPEQKAERDARKARKAEQAAKYKGLTDEQVKKVKAAERAQEQAQRMAARAAEAQAEAEALLAQSQSGGEDVAAQVEAAQSEAVEPDQSERRPRIGKRR